MTTLFIDIETFSGSDLGKTGVYRYSESPDFEVLLFGYSIDGGEVRVVDLASGEALPSDVRDALTDESVMKWTHNASFERVCLSRWLGLPTGEYMDSRSWRCTMVWSAYLGLPLSLESAAKLLRAEKQKLSEGKELIRYFSCPCKPTAANAGRTRNLPAHAPDKWQRYKAYNLRDVETEMAVMKRLSKFPVPDEEWENYVLDQEINDRGIRLDMDLVNEAIRCDRRSRMELMRVMRELTDLENPNSVSQIRGWLAENGLDTETLGKNAVTQLLKTAPEDLGEVLILRQDLAKSSVKKYTAMAQAVCSDGRARGLLQFYGANRTGRFAGRLIQVQNLPQNHLPDLAQARQLVKAGAFDMLETLYNSVPAVLSELIRTAFVPEPGCRFIVADFSAIEARVIAWLAGETWRNEVFATHGKIYEASASQMFRVPIEEITKGSLLRQKGKIAELALGYGGSVGALKAMGALEMGLKEEELRPLVNAWRAANPNIVKFWYAVENAAVASVKHNSFTDYIGIRFSLEKGILFIRLPSGRRLAYIKPQIEMNRFGRDALTYEGAGKMKKWERIETFGGKLTENIIQAVARDLLAGAMCLLHNEGFRIVMHCHDEVVIETENAEALDDVIDIMCQTPGWAKGLNLNADGYICEYYRKD